MIFADHQNKPDIGDEIARQWIDEDGVDMFADLPNSAVSLAVNQIAKDKNKSSSSTAPAPRRSPVSNAAQHRPLDLRHLGLGHALRRP